MMEVVTTARAKLSPRTRLGIWELHRGVCCICGTKIDGVRERWLVEHVRALELGGADEPDNMAPAHEACGIAKTRRDHASAAKAKRVKARHLGIRTSRRPLPGSKASGIRKRMNGGVEKW